jgi:DNA-binding MarR family transcriptional regulator
MTQPPVLTGQDIAEAQGAVQGALEHALAGTGTTSREYVVLRVLAVRGPFQSPASLHDFLAGQRQLALSPAAVAELLARLQARGLATGTAKNGPGPAQLTPEGAELFRSLAETVAPSTGDVFAGIAEDDLATTHRVLQQVIEQAHRLQHGNES